MSVFSEECPYLVRSVLIWGGVSVFREECPYLGSGYYEQKTIFNNTFTCEMSYLYVMTDSSSTFVQNLTDLSVI